ncbi:MAG TPA: MHYT domain-containing protein [Pilimelia sp.]|nr:MHYT domain-containing protein [Pilimelia sp.]
MAEVHHFTNGLFNPVAAFLLAFLGSLIGLSSAARGRAANGGRRQARWLVIAAFAIGGAGLWLMHFLALLGFEVPASPLRYDPLLTAASLVLAVGAATAGLLLVGRAPHTPARLAGGTVITALGFFAMHHAGVGALRVAGWVGYEPRLVGASALGALTTAGLALWFAGTVQRWRAIVVAAATLALAMCATHYAGMAALRVQLSADPIPVAGISPFLLVVPITLLAAAGVIGLAFTALQAMTEEEFGGETDGRHRAAAPPRALPAGAGWR